jgi:DNA-binding transcriptional LysR family regulator
VTFRHLEAFVEVALRGGFTRAAESLYLTQPTVSGQIKELEEELGVSLFHRLPRTVPLTEAGRLFLPMAKEIITARDRMAEAVGQYRGLLWGSLEVYASTIPGEYLLAPLIARFKAAHPGVKLGVRIRSSSQVIDFVQAGEAMLGVVGERPAESDLEFRPLWCDRIGLYTGARSPVPEAVDGTSLRELALVSREEGSGTRRAVEAGLGKIGLSPVDLRITAELGSTTAVKEAVKAGVGAGFLSDVAAGPEVAAGLLRPVPVAGLDPLERRFYAVRDPHRTLSPSGQAFLRFLLAEIP